MWINGILVWDHERNQKEVEKEMEEKEEDQEEEGESGIIVELWIRNVALLVVHSNSTMNTDLGQELRLEITSDQQEGQENQLEINLMSVTSRCIKSLYRV